MIKKTVVLLMVFFLCLATSAPGVSAQVISSYEELFTLFPGGIETMETNKPVVEEAQKRVAERQLLRRKRTIRFIKPIGFDIMNEKYISVAFEAQILPRKKAIFAILFETGAENSITFPNTMYLSWVGHNDLKGFEEMPLSGLYNSYQEMGVEDCKPGFMRTGVEKALMAKADIRHTHAASSIISGTIPDSVIPSGIARDAEVEKAVNATIAKLEAKIVQLERTVASLSGLLDGVTRKHDTIMFSNVNVQIVNGKGATHVTNGRGNLIVGYNEPRGFDSRQGSHNIVVGSKNDYSSYGGIVTGFNNDIGGKYANVIGGNNNVASGDYASITGGAKNNAKGKYSSIHGQSERTKVDEDENPHFK